MRRKLVAICLALAGLSLATGSTAAAAQGRNASRPVPATASTTQPAIPAPSVSEAPAQERSDDARQYAARFEVGEDEAERRLTAQVETGAATDALVREFGARLVGISVDHRPDYRINVLLTGDAPVADRVLTTSTMRVPVRFRTGAPATRQRILAAIETHQADIRRILSYPPGMGVDSRTGSLLVTVDAVDLARSSAERLTERFERMTGVPVTIRSLGGSENTGVVEGGSRVEGISPSDGRRYACTTGFVVTDGSRTGIVTAAHCPDTMSHVDAQRRETPLEFVGQWGWGYQDVQLHVSAQPMSGTFYADTARTRLRAVTGQLSRSETRAGDYVCHRGERTGYSCAEVEMTDFAPPGDLCGGPCLPTWVTVRGPDCQGGDSGAPVFSGGTAYGIVKGASYRSDGRCIFYFYMSTDYLPQGWSLVHGGPGTPPPAQVARAGAPAVEQAAARR